MNRYTVSKQPHGSVEWLKQRKWNARGETQIAGSDAAAVHGQHPFKSKADLAVELLSSEDPIPKEPNEAMERGNRLEPFLMNWVADRENLPLITPDRLYCYEEDGVRLIATLDAVAYPEEQDRRIVEIKTTNRRWAGALPKHWYWQGVHQAVCAGAYRIEWAIFDSDLVLHKHIQKVTSDEMQYHVDACRQFLAAIDMGFAPADAVFEFEHVSARYPQASEARKDLDGDVVMATLERLNLAREDRMRGEAMEDVCKAELCALLGDAEYGIVDGNVAFTWKNQTRDVFDHKRFEADHPALAAKYRRQSKMRVFRLSR